MIPVMSRFWMPKPTAAGGPAPGAASLVITGFAPSILKSSTEISVGAGSLVITGYAPTIKTVESVSPGVGALTISGYVPTVGIDTPVSAGVGALSIAGYAPTVVNSSDDAFAEYVELLIHFNGDRLDYSGLNRPVGDYVAIPTNDTGANPFGGDAFRWTGSTQEGVSTPSDEGLQFGTDQDFTIEMWFKIYARSNSANGSDANLGLMSKRNMSGYGGGDTWGMIVNNVAAGTETKAREIDDNQDRLLSGATTSLDTWYFIAISRETVGATTTIRGYQGAYGDSTATKYLEETTSYDYSGADYPLIIGAFDILNTFNGWIYDVRVTRAARYTGSTCPMPTEQFPNGSTRRRPSGPAALTITGHAPIVS